MQKWAELNITIMWLKIHACQLPTKAKIRRVNSPACSPTHRIVLRWPICSRKPLQTDSCAAPGLACVPVPTQAAVSRQITG